MASGGPAIRVPAAGGVPVAVTALDSTEEDITHRWVQFLPDGRRFLFFARTSSAAGGERDAICLGNLESPEITRLVRASSNAVYADGQIFFVRERTLMAMPFDAGAGRATGDAVPVAERVSVSRSWGAEGTLDAMAAV